MIEAFLVSTGVVALAEIGDKTQLLALLLAARWRKPVPIIAGILVATLLNHALAGWVGLAATAFVSPAMLQWVLGLSFLAIAVWMLIPDRIDDSDAATRKKAHGVFWATLVAFFFAEMGDKTQIATVALAAQYAIASSAGVWLVVLGTTLGMMIANVPVVLLGERIMRVVPLHLVRWIAATAFGVLGILAMAGVTRWA